MIESGISIIIPTLNEEARIGGLLTHLKRIAPGAELIVVDGGSVDRTRSVARESAQVLQAPRGRGVQMNFGAKAAGGEVFWFLHADCLPDIGCVAALLETLKNPDVVGGAFEYGLDEQGWIFRGAEALSNRKNRALKRIYGDMGIFVRRQVFFELGGYGERRLMEDYEFGKRLKQAGEIRILAPTIMTSARDWRREGPLRKLIKDRLIKTGYNLGVSGDRLYEWYYGKR